MARSPSTTDRGRTARLLLSCVWLAACAEAPPSGRSSATDQHLASTPVEAAPSSAPSASPAPVAETSTPGAPKSEPDFASIPWKTGGAFGKGIAEKDTKNVLGENVFIGFAGWNIDLEHAESWITALYQKDLRARGVRYVYAVRGPARSLYEDHELPLKAIESRLQDEVTADTHFILVDAHSSGACVAHDLLDDLAGKADPRSVTRDKLVFFSLDGDEHGLTKRAALHLKKGYFVAAFDPTIQTYSHEQRLMKQLGKTFPEVGGYFEYEVPGYGCKKGARWCMHMALITERPHDPTNANGPLDYGDFTDRQAASGYLEAKAAEAGLTPH